MYEARISRNHPAAFLILIDQFGSMSEPTTFHGRRMSKSEAVALTVNMLIDELLNRCKREEGYRDYFDIAVQGYHGDRVVSLWGDPERTFMRPSELAGAELCRVDVQQERTLPGGKTVVSVISQKIWVRPLASDKTPMYSALRRCHELCSQWCSRRSNRESYPPTIFNITDGESSEGDERRLLDAAESIRKLGTDDGTALLINIHICSDESRRQVLFPMSEQELPSSVMPGCCTGCRVRCRIFTAKHRPFARRGRRAFSRDELQCRNDGAGEHDGYRISQCESIILREIWVWRYII